MQRNPRSRRGARSAITVAGSLIRVVKPPRIMSSSDQPSEQRDCSLPAGCKDLLDVIKQEQISQPTQPSYPPVTRNITLPNVVAVRFLIEVSGQEPEVVTDLMHKLHILVEIDRSIDFGAAQRVLRHFGIWAERGPFTGLTI